MQTLALGLGFDPGLPAPAGNQDDSMPWSQETDLGHNEVSSGHGEEDSSSPSYFFWTAEKGSSLSFLTRFMFSLEGYYIYFMDIKVMYCN